MENSEDRAQDRGNPEARQEEELYEHVKQGEADYDTQTYGEEPRAAWTLAAVARRQAN